MSEPRDPDDSRPPAGLPEDERPVPSPPAGAPSPYDDHFGPEPWDVGGPPPDPAPAPPTIAPSPVAHAPPPHRDYGAGAPPEAFATGEATFDVKRPAFAVYLLYLTGLMLVGVPALVGVFVAYRMGGDAPGWLHSHYRFQIRTFWIALGAAIAAAVLLALPFGLGVPLIMALVVWVTLRCFVGMVRLHRGEPIYNPQTWLA